MSRRQPPKIIEENRKGVYNAEHIFALVVNVFRNAYIMSAPRQALSWAALAPLTILCLYHKRELRQQVKHTLS